VTTKGTQVPQIKKYRIDAHRGDLGYHDYTCEKFDFAQAVYQVVELPNGEDIGCDFTQNRSWQSLVALSAGCLPWVQSSIQEISNPKHVELFVCATHRSILNILCQKELEGTPQQQAH
jgi:hypothetical protein